ncbi:protein artichoke-like [Diprion similis]|uniref:protein artichoke-like n=1 Tax=Diprion similis TaxID=362088 RepID=UPI001EF9787F|nr:protein artichoke-like [Diprion similis]
MAMYDHFLLLILVCVSVFGIGQSYEEKTPVTICTQAELTLNLDEIGLTSLPNNFVSNEFLKTLSLQYNSIEHISVDTFVSVPNLSHLSLANNNLTTFQLRPFSTLQNLETLDLNGNCQLPTELDGDLTFPDDDDSDDNIIKTPSSYVDVHYCNFYVDAELPNLKYLHIENNRIYKIFTTGSNKLPSLTHVYLSYNLLRKPRDTTTALKQMAPSMTNLYMKNCGITELELLTTVIEVDLDDNNIKSICNRYCLSSSLSLQKAERLEILSMNNNEISLIENDAFNDTINLKKLDLSRNHLSEIRDGTFDNLHKLTYLSLEGNEFTTLSGEYTLSGLVNLEYLFFGGNNISYISTGFFDHLSKLVTLDMSYNRLTSIETTLCSKLTSLQKLSFYGNRLSSIHLADLKSIISIDLDDNNFTASTYISLVNLPNLESLYLRENPLRLINVDWLRGKPENMSISLGSDCAPEKDDFYNSSPIQIILDD